VDASARSRREDHQNEGRPHAPGSQSGTRDRSRDGRDRRVTVQGADQGDTTTIRQTLPEAAEQLEAVAAVTDDAVKVIEEVVADKGYHSRTTHGARGKRLLRRRGELLERPCAHLYETGGLRRANLRGHENVLKRLLVHASAFDLGLWMRSLFGVGTPRALQGRAVRFGPCSARCGRSCTRRSPRSGIATRRNTSQAPVACLCHVCVKTPLVQRAVSRHVSSSPLCSCNLTDVTFVTESGVTPSYVWISSGGSRARRQPRRHPVA
jgi:hypothetical protein